MSNFLIKCRSEKQRKKIQILLKQKKRKGENNCDLLLRLLEGGKNG